MNRDPYKARLASEQAIYRDCLDVHSLPGIFHYWSDKYIRPKLEEFGFSNPDGAFIQYLSRECSRRPGVVSQFVSIGAGNCDLEIGIARELRARGHSHFSIECLDLNPAMLKRGAVAAQGAEVASHLTFTCCDFNNWLPARQYDGVIANQSLHHVMQLENLFARVKDCLGPGARFIVSDMIGRNGHLRWPEALELVQSFWRKLPPSYRFNHALKRYEETFQNWDCSGEGFEGVRSQDILPLLLNHFHFEVFIGFANVIDPFVDRTFGVNFDPGNAWDRAFIDAVHACDESALRSGRVKPTHIVAVLGNDRSIETRFTGSLSPQFSVRDPAHVALPVSALSTLAPYEWDSWPHSAQRELEIACSYLRASTERIEELLAWGSRLDAEALERDDWAFSLQRDCNERTAWAQQLDRELGESRARAAALERESDNRALWAFDLEKQLAGRTEWALRLEHEIRAVTAQLEERTAWALRLDRELDERTAWASSLERELQEHAAIPSWVAGIFREFRISHWKAIQRLGAGAMRRVMRKISGAAT